MHCKMELGCSVRFRDSEISQTQPFQSVANHGSPLAKECSKSWAQSHVFFAAQARGFSTSLLPKAMEKAKLPVDHPPKCQVFEVAKRRSSSFSSPKNTGL